ncbi:hypothetical protein CB1_000699019 [Camelus ferus]|nr:hypothetical protein CB1_000699019 [Camelus ferus]
MRYADPSASRDLLGNRTLLFIFICAFALVTLLQQILYGRNYIKSRRRVPAQRWPGEPGNYVLLLNMGDRLEFRAAKLTVPSCEWCLFPLLEELRSALEAGEQKSTRVTSKASSSTSHLAFCSRGPEGLLCPAGLQFGWQSGDQLANWTGLFNVTDDPAVQSGSDSSSRYFEFYEGPFEYNSTRCLELRHEILEVKVLSMSTLSRCCNAPSFLFTTQKNTPLGTKLKYEVDTSGIYHINQEIFRMFPKVLLWAGRSGWGSGADPAVPSGAMSMQLGITLP